MGVTVQWDNDTHTALLFTTIDPWTWDDFDIAMLQVYAMLDEAPGKTPIICDFSRTISFPRGALKHLSRAVENLHRNHEVFVTVGANPLIMTINNMLARRYPHELRHTYHVNTLEEARALLSKGRWVRDLLRRIGG
jgi:integrase